jgi:uracil-DNA glycosylase
VPSFEMFARCPERFALPELEVLKPRPRVGVVIGANAADAFARAAGVAPKRGGPFSWWETNGTLLFGVPHPDRPGYSRRALVSEFADLVETVPLP